MKIDYVLNPDYACAGEIFKHITQQSNFAEGYQTINGISLIEFAVNKLNNVVGSKLKDCVGEFKGLLVAAISRGGRIIIPNGNTVFEETDDVFAIGRRNDVKSMHDFAKSEKLTQRISSVMIAGGGKTAYFLAKQLIAKGCSVKIIESIKKRAEYLAINLEKAMIVYGDATDTELLFEEGLESMDAFIACTGYDEENFMLGLYAKQKGIPNVISKMTRPNYSQMVNIIGDVMIINPVELCTAQVMRFIKEDENIVFSKMIQGQAEFMEINISPSMPICNKKLSELKVSEGIIIAGVFRNGELIVPRGGTVIQKNDKIVVLYLLSKMADLQTLLKNDEKEKF